MEFKASGSEVKSPAGRKNGRSSGSTSVRDAKTNPRSRRVNRSARADAFGVFSGQVLRDLNPRGPLESVLADHVVLSAWALQKAVDRQWAAPWADKDHPDRTTDKDKRSSTSAADRAARAVKESLESLDQARNCRFESEAPRPNDAQVEPIFSEVESNEWVVVPSDPSDDLPMDEPALETEKTPIWRDRLIFDFEVSDISPVVKGTWITVSHVITLIVDGHTWADILRSHPELTEDDIQVCVAYTLDQDGEKD